jgi:hypothetical protein
MTFFEKLWPFRKKTKAQVGVKLDGETLPTMQFDESGRPMCPNCDELTLLAGPSGGLCQNVACGTCRHEFNILNMPGGPFIEEQRGLMSTERAEVFGL